MELIQGILAGDDDVITYGVYDVDSQSLVAEYFYEQDALDCLDDMQAELRPDHPNKRNKYKLVKFCNGHFDEEYNKDVVRKPYTIKMEPITLEDCTDEQNAIDHLVNNWRIWQLRPRFTAEEQK